MPLFFYYPMIVWLGMFGVVQEQMRPLRVKARR